VGHRRADAVRTASARGAVGDPFHHARAWWKGITAHRDGARQVTEAGGQRTCRHPALSL